MNRSLICAVALAAIGLTACGGVSSAPAPPPSTPAAGEVTGVDPGDTHPELSHSEGRWDETSEFQATAEPAETYETEEPLEPDSAAVPLPTEPESDADRWVDGRQDDVLRDVHDNNMDAVDAWTP